MGQEKPNYYYCKRISGLTKKVILFQDDTGCVVQYLQTLCSRRFTIGAMLVRVVISFQMDY